MCCHRASGNHGSKPDSGKAAVDPPVHTQPQTGTARSEYGTRLIRRRIRLRRHTDYENPRPSDPTSYPVVFGSEQAPCKRLQDSLPTLSKSTLVGLENNPRFFRAVGAGVAESPILSKSSRAGYSTVLGLTRNIQTSL